MRLGDLDALKENMMIAFDCENATKYGNKDAEQQAHSYSTLMLYEISNIVEDCIDNAPTVDTDEIYKKGYHNGFFATHDVPPTVEPTYISDMPDDKVKDLQELAIDYGEGIAVFERKRPQGEQIAWEQGYEFGKNEKRPQGEWIPVSERLPEALQSVLVTSKSGRVYTSYIAHGDWEYGGEVIAWQPLPEPYKKGGAE